MDNDDAHYMAKKQILKLAKNNFVLWLISLIFVFIAGSASKGFLYVITLIILVLMLIKSIKLSVLIKSYFNIIYKIYGPHSNEKRNSLIVSFANIGIICLATLLFIGGGSNWYVVPLILLSFIMFCGLGASLSGGGAK
jgi:c-di-AMP phosphodiesterase-like protein